MSDYREEKKADKRKITTANEIFAVIFIIIPSCIKMQRRHAALAQSILFRSIAQ